MSGARSSHEQKTRGDREKYFRTTVRRTPSSTIDEPFGEVDSTETPAPPPETGQQYQPTQTKSPFGIGAYLREHISEIILIVIVAPILAFMAVQIYSLNREVGELKTEFKARIDESHAHEQRLEAQIDKLNDRLDRLTQVPPPGKKEP